MSDIFSGAESMIGAIRTQRKKAQQSAVDAERLPYELTKAYREQGDPKLEKQINTAEAKSLNAGYEGLDKYQYIENPFTRRALASKYQGSVASEYKNLLSEQDRRQGVISDYIKTWAGTYGAIAKGEQMALEGMKEEYTMEMDIASKRASASKKAGGSGTGGTYTEQEIRQAINEGFAKKESWETIAQTLAGNGIDVSSGSVADNELRRLHGDDAIDPKAKEKELTPKQELENKYYTLLQQIQGDDRYEVDADGNIIDTKGWNKVIMQKP